MAKNYNTGKKGITGNTVIVGDLPIAVALRKFKKKVEESGVLQDYLDKQFYEKPTTERKRKKGSNLRQNGRGRREGKQQYVNFMTNIYFS